jgi:hypothetical protein
MEIKDYEIDGLIQTIKETGIKGLMKYTDVIVWNHILERNWCSDSSREGQIKFLKEESDMSFGEITNLLQRYNEWKEYLPSYSLGLNQRLDGVNKQSQSIVPFKWVGNESNKKLIGIVKEGSDIKIYDSTGKQLMLIGSVDESGGIHWNDYVKLTTPQQKYLINKVKSLKGIIL